MYDFNFLIFTSIANYLYKNVVRKSDKEEDKYEINLIRESNAEYDSSSESSENSQDDKKKSIAFLKYRGKQNILHALLTILFLIGTSKEYESTSFRKSRSKSVHSHYRESTISNQKKISSVEKEDKENC